MKRNIFQRLVCSRQFPIAALLAGGLLVSCNDDIADNGSGKPLPEGRYPVVLTTEVTTRVTGDGTWDGGEYVAVHARPYIGWEEGKMKVYKADNEGRLTSDDPFWWTHSEEKMDLRAWYCGNGLTAPGGRYSLEEPSFWNVCADQSGSGETDGYKASDLLFAPERKVAFAGGGAVPLTFYHQTAKVVVNIRKSAYLTSAGMLRSVRIGDGNLVMSAGFEVPVPGNTAGRWRIREYGDGTITPRRMDAPSGDEYIASYCALVIPQPTAGKLMVSVVTKDGLACYTAPADAAPLETGKVMTYNVTVSMDGAQHLGLEVGTVTGNVWTGDGRETVASREVKVYTADDIKPGDYFYKDGTTSDGGLRRLYSDGTYKAIDLKPAPEKGKEVVGIVFQTDPERIGKAEKDALGGDVHGLVMSVKNVGASIQWGTGNKNEPGLDDFDQKSRIYGDISGYANYMYICTEHKDELDGYPAFKAVEAYNEECPVAGKTTGWFLPSAGQWWDILQNLGCISALADPARQQSGDRNYEHRFAFDAEKNENAVNSLNDWLEPVTAAKNIFAPGHKYYTSSERGEKVWTWLINTGDVYVRSEDRTESFMVRPVLAF